jgi:hypothetical protein
MTHVSVPTSTGAVPPTPAQTHGCVRCGAECPIDVALCEDCNPLGLQQPAATQVHGTVFLAIGVAVVILAVLGRVALNGIGPFAAQVDGVKATSTGLTVTLAVTNEGKGTGATTCRVFDTQNPALGPTDAFVTTPRIAAGGTALVQMTVTSLGTTVRPLGVTCQGP